MGFTSRFGRPTEYPQDWATHRSRHPSRNGDVALLASGRDDLAVVLRARQRLDRGDEPSPAGPKTMDGAPFRSCGVIRVRFRPVPRYRRELS